MMLGSGGFPNCGAPENNASTAMTTIMPTQKTTSRQAASGQNGCPFFSISSLYSCAVGFGINRFAGFGRLGNSVAQNQPKMQPDKGKNERGHDENVNRKKPGQGRAADGVAAQSKMRQPFADERHAPGLFRRDNHGPDGVLIPRATVGR